MNIQNWNMSAYVTYISNALLSFVWRVAPPIKEGKPPGSLVSHERSISYPVPSYNIILNNQLIKNSTFCTITPPHISLPDIRLSMPTADYIRRMHRLHPVTLLPDTDPEPVRIPS